MTDWPSGFALSRLGPMLPSRSWETCPKCLTRIRGAHDCKATPERLAILRYLLVRLSLHADKRRSRKQQSNVVDLKPLRRAAGR